MCYSAGTSLTTLLVNHVSALVLYYTYDKPLGIFLLFAGFMQFWDFLFWENPGENWINYWSTKMAMISNNIQPIVLGLALYFYREGKGFTEETWWVIGGFAFISLL